MATFDLRPMRKRGRGSDGEFDMRPMKRTIDANHIRPMKRGGDVENDNRLCHNNGKDQCVTKDPYLTYSIHLVRGLINNRLISNLVKQNKMDKVWATLR